jgi:ariadne-1
VPPTPTSRTFAAAWLVPSSGGTGLYLITTSSTRKRKAPEADGHLTPSEGPPQKRQTPETPFGDLPATPVTNASDKMDSEDDFNSSMSGNEFDDDSEMDLEEGRDII